MKIKTGLYIAAAFCLLAFSATSCSDDDEVSVEPLTEESVRGDYAGSILAGTGEAADAALSVGDDIIIADFPVDSIVKLAVPAAAYDEAMASVPAVCCTVGYSARVYGLNLLLALRPDPLEFEVNYEGTGHKMVAELYASLNGNFNGSDQSLSFELLLKTLTVDGNEVNVKEALPYKFSGYKLQE